MIAKMKNIRVIYGLIQPLLDASSCSEEMFYSWCQLSHSSRIKEPWFAELQSVPHKRFLHDLSLGLDREKWGTEKMLDYIFGSTGLVFGSREPQIVDLFLPMEAKLSRKLEAFSIFQDRQHTRDTQRGHFEYFKLPENDRRQKREEELDELFYNLGMNEQEAEDVRNSNKDAIIRILQLQSGVSNLTALIAELIAQQTETVSSHDILNAFFRLEASDQLILLGAFVPPFEEKNKDYALFISLIQSDLEFWSNIPNFVLKMSFFCDPKTLMAILSSRGIPPEGCKEYILHPDTDLLSIASDLLRSKDIANYVEPESGKPQLNPGTVGYAKINLPNRDDQDIICKGCRALLRTAGIGYKYVKNSPDKLSILITDFQMNNAEHIRVLRKLISIGFVLDLGKILKANQNEPNLNTLNHNFLLTLDYRLLIKHQRNYLIHSGGPLSSFIKTCRSLADIQHKASSGYGSGPSRP